MQDQNPHSSWLSEYGPIPMSSKLRDFGQIRTSCETARPHLHRRRDCSVFPGHFSFLFFLGQMQEKLLRFFRLECRPWLGWLAQGGGSEPARKSRCPSIPWSTQTHELLNNLSYISYNCLILAQNSLTHLLQLPCPLDTCSILPRSSSQRPTQRGYYNRTNRPSSGFPIHFRHTPITPPSTIAD